MELIKILQNPNLVKHTRTPEDLKAMLNAIDYLPGYVGASKWGTDERPIVLLANFIFRRFPTIYPENLVEAFELAASGSLYQDNKRVKVTSYGKTLDIDLVGTVLSAYKEHKREEARRPKPIIPASRQLNEGPKFKPTGKYFYGLMMKDVKAEGKLPIAMVWKSIHEYMCEEGLLNPIKVPVPSGKSDKFGSIGSMFSSDIYRADIEKYLIEKKLITKD